MHMADSYVIGFLFVFFLFGCAFIYLFAALFVHIRLWICKRRAYRKLLHPVFLQNDIVLK